MEWIGVAQDGVLRERDAEDTLKLLRWWGAIYLDPRGKNSGILEKCT
jgi:hypothetical protein